MTTLPEAIDKIRALRPVLYVGRPGARVGVNYPKGFDDGFNDALEQVDVILASVNQADVGGEA